MFREFYLKYRLWLWLGAAILVINIAVFIFVSMPKINSDSIARQRLQSVQQAEAEMVRQLETRRHLAEAVNGKITKLDYFLTDILGIKADRLTTILEEREKISNTFGVVPTRVRYISDEVRNQPLERFNMSFPLEGSYTSLRFFLNTLESSNSFFIIEDVELESSATDEGSMSMRINVSTYFKRDIIASDRIPEAEMEDEL